MLLIYHGDIRMTIEFFYPWSYITFGYHFDETTPRPTISTDFRILFDDTYFMILTYEIPLNKWNPELRSGPNLEREYMRNEIMAAIEGRLENNETSDQSESKRPHILRVTIWRYLDNGKEELYFAKSVIPILKEPLRQWSSTFLYTGLSLSNNGLPVTFRLVPGKYKLVVEAINMDLPFQFVKTSFSIYGKNSHRPYK